MDASSGTDPMISPGCSEGGIVAPPGQEYTVASEPPEEHHHHHQEHDAANTTVNPAPPPPHEGGPVVVNPTPRDVVLGGTDSMDHVSNMLVEDLLHGKSDPESENEVRPLAKHIVALMKNGRDFELAGLSDVPKPFLKSRGRFLRVDEATHQYNEVTDQEAEQALATLILSEFKADILGDLSEAPYKNLRLWLSRQEEKNVENAEFMPEGIDTILLPCGDFLAEKMYENQGGNRMIFNLASQFVNSYVCTPMKRVAAALTIMEGLDDVSIDHCSKPREMTTTKNVRFLIRRQTSDSAITWDIMDPASAAEFCVMFVFEVFLEKDLHLNQPTVKQNDNVIKPATEPVLDPSDNDVLFGRGGMTNSHPGNRRFRDVIALHRPDYIRAQKMDKPAVAVKIVRAMRTGPLAGRFLKKRDDGKWYDVGDRAAMEKTSQGLRERTNAEKRQRSALREALRIRKEDLEDGIDTPNKKLKLMEMDDYTGQTITALNYVGTNISVPLSLSMKDTGPDARSHMHDSKPAAIEFNSEGLPPNAVDEDGNILVTDYDILCGRGGLTNHHKGNKRFRDIVALHRPDYVRAPKIQKPSVARVIVRAIRNGDPPGRFLRKDDVTGKWVDIGDKKAAEKTSQALREKTGEEREKGKPSPEALASLIPAAGGEAPYTINPVMFASIGQPIHMLGAQGNNQKHEIKVEDLVPSPMLEMPEPTIIDTSKHEHEKPVERSEPEEAAI